MNIKEYIKNNLLILDGGMGTILQEKGLKPGELPERWNIEHPQIITEVHRNYFDNGSNVVNTNTFGANSLKFSDEELFLIISSAVNNAKKALKESTSKKEKWISLDIGPLGKMLKPLGELDFEDAVSVFAKTVKIGVQCGVDLITIETMNDSYETKAALLAAKENSNLPVFVSNAYNDDGKLMTGADPYTMVSLLEGLGADAIGVNCSLGPKELSNVVKKYLEVSSLPVILKPNAGLPKVKDGKTVYNISPDEFCKDVFDLVKCGARIIGGCCGTTPEYIKKLFSKVKDFKPEKTTQKDITSVCSYNHTVFFDKKPILIGERINPTGKKRLKQAIISNDIDYILNEALSQKEKGADILDVNVGLPQIDEVSFIKNIVCELQAVIDLPLQIDTSDFDAMEKALRYYNGKAMINSVNGKKEIMDKVFPLAKKYGGLIVALTLDENGIPQSANERLDIAKRILKEAEKYGICKKDIIFDPLALTVSTDSNAANETLKTVRLIKNELGAKTTLGISNVSFGLPKRDILNSSFFLSALNCGLSAAIMNPFSDEMMKSYYAFCALSGIDESFTKYIEYASSLPENEPVKEKNVAEKSGELKYESNLQEAIIKGLKERTAQLTESLLNSIEPLKIVEEEVIPALNTVGIGFENKTVYLPSLLMSAEAAKCAFEKIKQKLEGKKASGKCSVIIATVKGDIHDIGKNIVKLLLENYGFDVYDLGKDVSPEIITEKAVELHSNLVGLSALMTTTVPSMEKTIKMLKEKAPWCKIIVGGAVLNKEYADMIGADMYAKDAMETVRYAESIYSQIKESSANF